MQIKGRRHLAKQTKQKTFSVIDFVCLFLYFCICLLSKISYSRIANCVRFFMERMYGNPLKAAMDSILLTSCLSTNVDACIAGSWYSRAANRILTRDL